MRHLRPLLLALAFATCGVLGGLVVAVTQPSNYFEQGTQRLVIGGTQTVVSGGILNVATGGQMQFNGVDQAAALATAPSAVAAGYKLARGETALDGSNPTPVTTGLTTVVACALTIKLNSAPGDNTSVVTYDSSAGTMNMYAWKNTGGTDPTLVASTGTETVGWVCVGT